MQSKLSMTNRVNNSAAFIARIIIPVWWLVWVVKSIQSGYIMGFVLAETPPPYPWLKVLQVCLLLAFESAILYAILRPDFVKWSFARTLTALVLFCGLIMVQDKRGWFDIPGYAYVPGEFAISTARILVVWLLVTIVHAVFIQLNPKRAHNPAA